MKLKLLTAGAVAALGLWGAGAANAAVTINFVNVGDTATVNYDGEIDGTVIPGLTGKIVYSLASISGNNRTFNYTLSNTSSAPITGSRISTFGFDTTPNLTSASVLTGSVFTGVNTGNVPNIGVVEFCLTAGPNCAGGGGGGVTLGGSTSGSFQLNFGAPFTTLTLDTLYVRYQSITAPGIADGSGVGKPTVGINPLGGGIPEPATWAMMLLGFGRGTVLRMQRRRLRAQLA